MIVSNTTPLSNFLHLGQMEILKTIFKKLQIPMAVHSRLKPIFQATTSGKDALVRNLS
jgi:predicted nucleic acid-binding protein